MSSLGKNEIFIKLHFTFAAVCCKSLTGRLDALLACCQPAPAATLLAADIGAGEGSR